MIHYILVQVTYFSNNDNLLWVFLNQNLYLYVIFCIWPSFIVYNIYLKELDIRKYFHKKKLVILWIWEEKVGYIT